MLGFHGISVAPISALVGVEGAISGTISVAFTTSGTLVGAGALSGVSSVAFTTSGTLVGVGALSGALTFTFSTSGALVGTGSLSGQSNVSFSVSGSLGGIASISGSIDLLFSVSGTLGAILAVLPFTGTDRIGAHEYFPWHSKDGLTVYFNKGGHRRRRYFPTDQERQDVLVRKKQTIANPTTIQELDWDVYNFFDVALNADVEFTFSNPRDNSDFVILLTKDANATVRNVIFPSSLAWPDGNSFSSISSSGESKLIRVSYFGGRYRATLY